ncbi:MAG: FAD-dependent oxidoreductase, partial [Planctomycetaceae bacterium]
MYTTICRRMCGRAVTISRTVKTYDTGECMRAGWLRISGIVLIASAALGSSSPADNSRVRESARELPLVYSVDVVVVGGSSGAVAAACEAARCGARVFLATPKPYLGDDLCATLRLWADPK